MGRLELYKLIVVLDLALPAGFTRTLTVFEQAILLAGQHWAHCDQAFNRDDFDVNHELADDEAFVATGIFDVFVLKLIRAELDLGVLQF